MSPDCVWFEGRSCEHFIWHVVSSDDSYDCTHVDIVLPAVGRWEGLWANSSLWGWHPFWAVLPEETVHCYGRDGSAFPRLGSFVNLSFFMPFSFTYFYWAEIYQLFGVRESFENLWFFPVFYTIFYAFFVVVCLWLFFGMSSIFEYVFYIPWIYFAAMHCIPSSIHLITITFFFYI